MIKMLMTAGVIATSALFGGCAYAPYQPGVIYSDMSGPVAVTGNPNCVKKGTASTTNVLALVGIGDASVEAAKKEGGISTVSSVDYTYTSVLGIFGKTVTTVCGN